MAEPWKPKTKSEAGMDRHYRGQGVRKRMDAAIAKVMDEGETQAEAARRCGVSRPQLNKRVVEARAKLAELQRRSDVARAERAGQDLVPALQVTGEVRRVPDFETFDRMYFSQLECPDCGVHHETPKFHVDMMEAVTDPAVKRLLINLPPYHAKSTTATVKSTVYELCRDPNGRTMIVSKSQRLAERFLYSIGKYLTDPAVYDGGPNLIQDWGPFQSSSNQWNNQQIYIAGRSSAEKDPSVSAYGFGGHIYGVRADRILFDDVADLENQRTAHRVEEMLQWATQEAGSRVGRNGKLIFVGTRVAANDIYSFLQELPSFQVLRYPCVLDDEDKSTLWPEHFPYEAAMLMKDTLTPEQWQLVYQNVDVPGFGSSFPAEIIEACYDAEYSLGQYNPQWALVAGLDPAGANAQSGYTAFVLIGIDLQTGKRYLVDMVAQKQMKAPQMRDQIFDWAQRYPLREFRVEVNGLQAQLTQYNTEIQAELTNRGVRFVPHITTGHNKWDPVFGVEAMAPMFYNRMIGLPTQDHTSRSKIRPLVEQLTQFPMGQVQDLVMALWFAELGAKDLYRRAATPLFDPRRRMPAHIRRRQHVVDFAAGEVRAPSPEALSGRAMFMEQDRPEPKRFVNVSGELLVY